MMRRTYTHQIDAKHYGFVFNKPQEITVEYSTEKLPGGEIRSVVMEVRACPVLLMALTHNDAMLKVLVEIEESAKHNAQMFWMEKHFIGALKNDIPAILQSLEEK
jgi:hypothetical protein